MSLSAEQIELRKTHICASEVATIAGLNPWETATELVMRKRGLLEPRPETQQTRAGHAMEVVLSAMVSERTGLRLRRSNETLRNSYYPWLIGHIDRRYEGVRRGLELKNCAPFMQRYWGNDGDEIPDYVRPQVATYILLSGFASWDVAAYFGGSALRLFEIDADPDIAEWLIDTTRDFYARYIEGDAVPEIDPEHPHALDALKTIHKTINQLEVHADERIDHWHHVWTDAKEQIARLKDTCEVAEAQLRAHMGNAGTLLIPSGGRYERKLVHRKAYAVADLDYETMRFIKPKKTAAITEE